MAEVVLKKYGHSLDVILKQADVAVDWNSCGFHELLCAGIWLNKGTKKYWLDKKTNSNGFIFYARSLTISWMENPQYWRWIIIKESCNTAIEVAELLKVCWLDIRGKIQISLLSPNIQYEVLFVVKLNKDACGWNVPVNIELKKANVIIHQRKQCMLSFRRGEWVEISVGTFSLTDADICGCADIEFSIFEHGGHWKYNLFVKSAIIRPKLLC